MNPATITTLEQLTKSGLIKLVSQLLSQQNGAPTNPATPTPPYQKKANSHTSEEC